MLILRRMMALFAVCFAVLLLTACTEANNYSAEQPLLELATRDDVPSLSNDEMYTILTQTRSGALGITGFEGDHALTANAGGMVEIVVQFVTPPQVALELIEELNQGREIGTRRSREARSRRGSRNRFRDEARAAHDAFSDQLNQRRGDFFSRRISADVEITSEYYRLFNGVIMRVPAEWVETIATLPEVFAVTPHILPEPMPNANLLAPAFFENPDFMGVTRDYFNMDYINHNMGITGQGVRVAVIDTGIYHNHPEFERFLDNTGRIPGWQDFDNTAGTNNHGTAVSGAVIGIAPGIQLWNYRIALSGIPAPLSPIAGIELAHRDGMDVMNLSWGGGLLPFHPTNQAVNLAVLDGIVVVASAGNSGQSWDASGHPEGAALAIGVGAGHAGGATAYRGDRLRDYSARGPVRLTGHISPNIVAPSGLTTTSLGGEYITNASGTSFSAPIIAGVAALLIEAFPDATPAEITARIMNTARPLQDMDPNRPFDVGAGFVQPYEALTTDTIVTAYYEVPLTADVNAPWENHQMASLSFGMMEDLTSTIPVTIANRAGVAREFSIEYMFSDNPEALGSLSFSEVNVTVPAGGTATIDVTLEISPNAAFLAAFEGYLYIREEGNLVARLPFAGLAQNLDPSAENWFRQAVAAAQPGEPTMIELDRSVILTGPMLRTPDGTDITIIGVGDTRQTLFFFTDTSNFVLGENSRLTLEGFDIIQAPHAIQPTIDLPWAYNSHLLLRDINMIGAGGGAGSASVWNNAENFVVIENSTLSNNFFAVVNWGGTVTMKSGALSDNILGFHGMGGHFTMEGGAISDNIIGVIKPRSALGSSVFLMEDGEISGNALGVDNHENGVFIMEGGTITRNSAPDGDSGAVFNLGTFTMTGGVISHNSGHYGAGVDNAGTYTIPGVFNMEGGRIEYNESLYDGAGIYNRGEINLTGGYIKHNTAIRRGGGIYHNWGEINIEGGYISHNTALENGGGIFLRERETGAATLNVIGGSINDNTAMNGGGIGVSIEAFRNQNLVIESQTLFENNTATSGPRNRAPEDDLLYYEIISAATWTYPFTQGFNNFDIGYTFTPETSIQWLYFELNDTTAAPATFDGDERIKVVASSIFPINSAMAIGVPIVDARSFPADPTRTGYDFLGWYLDADFEEPLLETTLMPDRELTLYARWRAGAGVNHIFEFIKLSSRGGRLPGATFNLYARNAADTDWEQTPLATVTSSDPDGIVRFEGLSLGAKYRLVETEAPEGYLTPPGYWVVETRTSVSTNDPDPIYEITPIDTITPEGIIQQPGFNSESSMSPTGEVQVTHSVSNHRADENHIFEFTKSRLGGGRLPGATFNLYARNAADTGWEQTPMATMTSSDPDGIVRFEGLSLGARYRLVETRAPEGYLTPPGYWVVETRTSVSANNPNPIYSIKAIDTITPVGTFHQPGFSWASTYIHGRPVYVTHGVANFPKIRSDLIFTKMDRDVTIDFANANPLPNGRFSLYEYVGGGWRLVSNALTSGTNGQVSIPNLVVGQGYRLIQTQAPPGFSRPQGYWLFTIEESGRMWIVDTVTVGATAQPEFIFTGGVHYVGSVRSTEQNFGPDPDLCYPADYTITINRRRGSTYELPTGGAPLEGVPHRIERVRLRTDIAPADPRNPAHYEPVPGFVQPPTPLLTDANGQIIFTTTTRGIWRVTELDNDIVLEEDRIVPFLVSLPHYLVSDGWQCSVSVYPKANTENLGNVVKENIDFDGEIATWRLGVTIPQTIEQATKLTIVDSLDPRLTLIESTVRGTFTRLVGDTPGIFGVGTQTGILSTNPPNPHFEVINNVAANNVTISITNAGFQYLATNGLLNGNGRIYFTMETRVTIGDTQQVGDIENQARFYFNDREPLEDYDTITALELEILKVEVGGQRLAGAQFRLYREVTATTPGAIPVTRAGVNDVYVLPVINEDGTPREATTNADGIALIRGIYGTDLWLREVAPPVGYRVIHEWMPVNVSHATRRIEGEVITYTVGVRVYNERAGGWTLPNTGGRGTIILTVAGFAVVSLSFVLYLKSLTKNSSKR